MSEARKYILGQSASAARRLELQDTIFAEVSDKLLDQLALRPQDRVVEFGCGPGGFSRRIISRLGKEGVLVAVDGSADLLTQARAALYGRNSARFETVLGDLSELGSWLDGADAVVGRAILHHVPAAECVLGRMRARLRPGTRIGFLEPDLRSPLGQISYLEATGQPQLAPLRVFATVVSNLYQLNRISPAVGATLHQTLENCGYRNVRSSWTPCVTNDAMLENMRLIYDEIRERLHALGLITNDEVIKQQRLLQELKSAGAAACRGDVRRDCGSVTSLFILRASHAARRGDPHR